MPEELRKFKIALAAIIAVSFLGCASQSEQAGPYPDRPIKVVVPFAAGGGTDAFARIIKRAIEENDLLSQPLVIVNVSGAGATIGSRRVLMADPDGYTVLLLHDAIVMSKHAGRVKYGPDAFEAVAGTSENGTVVVAREDSEYANLKDAVDDAVSRPNEVTFGCNLGTPTHYVGLLVQRERPGADFRFVHSGDGAKRFHDLKGGHIDLTVFSNEEYLRYREDGVRALAFFSKERHPLMPDVPTAIEQGFNAEAGIMQYWWMPKNTPPDRVQAFADVLQQAMQTDTVRNWLAQVQSDPTFAQGEALQQRIEHLEAQVSTVNFREETNMPNLPLIVLACAVALGLVVGVRALRTANSPVEKRETTIAPQYGLAVLCGVLAIVYVLALSFNVAGRAIVYPLATLGFVAVMGALLARNRWRAAPWVVGLALLMAFGLQYVLTQIFEVDLP